MTWGFVKAKLAQILSDGLRKSGQIRRVVPAVIKKLKGSRSVALVKKFLNQLLKLGSKLGKIRKN